MADFFFFNWDSLHARLNSHQRHGVTRKEAQKKLQDTENLFRKKPTVKRYLLILDLNPLRSWVKGKHSIGREFQSLAM